MSYTFDRASQDYHELPEEKQKEVRKAMHCEHGKDGAFLPNMAACTGRTQEFIDAVQKALYGHYKSANIDYDKKFRQFLFPQQQEVFKALRYPIDHPFTTSYSEHTIDAFLKIANKTYPEYFKYIVDKVSNITSRLSEALRDFSGFPPGVKFNILKEMSYPIDEETDCNNIHITNLELWIRANEQASKFVQLTAKETKDANTHNFQVAISHWMAISDQKRQEIANILNYPNSLYLKELVSWVEQNNLQVEFIHNVLETSEEDRPYNRNKTFQQAIFDFSDFNLGIQNKILRQIGYASIEMPSTTHRVQEWVEQNNKHIPFIHVVELEKMKLYRSMQALYRNFDSQQIDSICNRLSFNPNIDGLDLFTWLEQENKVMHFCSLVLAQLDIEHDATLHQIQDKLKDEEVFVDLITQQDPNLQLNDFEPTMQQDKPLTATYELRNHLVAVRTIDGYEIKC